MGLIRQWLLFVTVLSLSVGVYSQDDVEDISEEGFDIVEKAFLLVRHKIDTVELVQGKNTSVVVELYNAGNRYSLVTRSAYSKRLQQVRRTSGVGIASNKDLLVNSLSLISAALQCCNRRRPEGRQMASVRL